MIDLLKKYYTLTKPGVLYGNVLTTIAGFLLASHGTFQFLLFVSTVFGTTLVIASACVLNNYLDRDIDSLMERTKNRPTAKGTVNGLHAISFSLALGIIGMIILFLYTNLLVVFVGIIGYIDYVWLYGALSKRMSVHGTLVGSVSGAMPILAGYVAVTNTIDIGAVLVFLILFFWQMPEFYSISIYRHDEYKKAGVPVISVIKGIDATKKQVLYYIFAFVLATFLLSIFAITGITYGLIMAICGVYWIRLGFQLQRAEDVNIASRKMFRFSLVILLVFCLMISINSLLP